MNRPTKRNIKPAPCSAARSIVARLIVLTLVIAALPAKADIALISPQAILADQFARLARQVLGGDGRPREDQLQRAVVLLDLALAARGDDVELIELRAELARTMGDSATATRMMHRYGALRPNDDAAMLEQIFASVADKQTLQARAAAIEAIAADPRAESFSHALRSRLASYIARAAKETGDDAAMGRWLKDAIARDTSNIDAAQLLYELVVDRDPQPQVEAQALVAVIQAAPADPSARQRIAELMLAQGVYNTAAEQFAAAAALGAATNERLVGDWARSLALAGQQPQALQLLESFGRLTDELEAIEAALRGNVPPPGIDPHERPTEAGRQISTLFRQVPREIRLPGDQSHPWLVIDVDIEPARLGYLEPVEATLRLRNLTDIPLSLGSGGAVGATAFVVAAPLDGQAGFEPAPIVVNLQRRLRLDAGEALTVDVRLDRSPLGLYLASHPASDVTFNGVAALNPIVQADGSVIAPYRRASDETDRIVRRGLPATEADIASWLASAQGEGADRLRAMVRLAQLAVQPGAPQGLAEQVDTAAARLDATSLAALICLTPAGDVSRQRLARLHELAGTSDDPAVRVAYLATHVNDVLSPSLVNAVAHSDRQIETFAQFHAQALLAMDAQR